MKKTVNIFVKIFLVIAIIACVGGIYYLHTRVSKLESNGAGKTQLVSEKLSGLENTTTSTTDQARDYCGSDCEKKIAEEVAKAVATISSNKNCIPNCSSDFFHSSNRLCSDGYNYDNYQHGLGGCNRLGGLY